MKVIIYLLILGIVFISGCGRDYDCVCLREAGRVRCGGYDQRMVSYLNFDVGDVCTSDNIYFCDGKEGFVKHIFTEDELNFCEIGKN